MGYFTLLIFIWLSFESSLAVGSCVTFQSVNATMYRVPRYTRVSWAAHVSGCNLINWNIHYDCTSPVRNFQNKTLNSGVFSTFVPVTPSFNYEIYIEAQTNSGQTVRSSKVTYSAPKDKPSAAPSRFHATSIQHDSIVLAWQKVDLLHKNGDVSGYRLAYRDASTGAVKYFDAVGEDFLNATLTGLQPKHTYQIMIQCINDVGGGPYSSPMLTITLPEPPTTTTTTTTTTFAPSPTITTLVIANHGTFTKTGSCVTFQNVKATMYRVPKILKVTWSAHVSGCNVISWNVHYDSTSPMRIFHNRSLTTGNSTFVPVTPCFNYEIYIEAQINNGQIIRSSKVTYSAPKDKPYAAPSRFHATSIKHDSIALGWQKVDLLHKNGDVSGYRIAYRDASTGAVKYFNVVGEDSLNITLTGLQPKHTYQIMIQCINDVSGGPFSSPMLTITLPEPPTTTTTTTTTIFAPSPTITKLVIANHGTFTKTGSCVTFQDVTATMYRVPRYLTITWSAQVSGCNVSNWNVHYDSTSPIRIFQSRNETALKSSSFVPVTPSFNYEIYIDAQTNSGQTVRSTKVTYSAPKDKPYAAPSRLHATSIKHDSIALVWQKVDLLHKNGDVRGYRIAYRDTSTGTVNYASVVGEDSLNTTLTGLQPKHTYQIMIQCINDVSGGPFSSPMLTITVPEPPITTSTTTTTTTTTFAPLPTITPLVMTNHGNFTKKLIGISAVTKASSISDVTVSIEAEKAGMDENRGGNLKP